MLAVAFRCMMLEAGTLIPLEANASLMALSGSEPLVALLIHKMAAKERSEDSARLLEGVKVKVALQRP